MSKTIALIGLGYVGLPLAVNFAVNTKHKVIGFDVDTTKIDELRKGHDRTHEVGTELLKKSPITYTTNPKDIATADIIIVTVPTPVDSANTPDLTMVRLATKTVGENMKKGAIVVYESTVYPGVTEDICRPILENASGFVYNKEFFLGYSPERINPGDKLHTVDKIVKVVSGSTPEVLEALSQLYGEIITAGIHKAANIKVAEAAKVIENVQRDLNIALVNELAVLFDMLDIDVHAVLEAAGTKWNFHKYTPGLVGGHCIGVDPYYLTYKAQEVGMTPEIILAGRRLNDNMHKHYVEKVVQKLNKHGVSTAKATVAVLGLTFKEDVPDMRNSRSKQLIAELKKWDMKVLSVDPWLTEKEHAYMGGVYCTLDDLEKKKPDAIIIAVPHKEFFSHDFTKYAVVVDIKNKVCPC